MWKITGASIIGADHKMSGKVGSRNCQDAHYMHTSPEVTIGIVSDGCSSGSFSEVGAHIGVNTLGTSLVREINRSISAGYSFTEWERFRLQFLSRISVLVESMGTSYSSTIGKYFLFSIVGFVITPSKVMMFSCGDGSYFVNGIEKKIGPFPNNEPPYIAYGLLGGTIPKFEVAELPLGEVQSIAVGTDGVDYLGDADVAVTGWLLDKNMFSNPDQLRRSLVLRNPERVENGMIRSGPLKDDIALVMAKHFEA